MNFGIMFFSSMDQAEHEDRYHLVKEIARFADRRGFSSIWTPERHFHPFGGLFPNPSVLSAALAMITNRIQIRAGSLVSPLHHTLRIAEEWSVVDNLSSGRVAISFGSGWNVNDFIFGPERYAERRRIMFEQIRMVQELWRGNSIMQTNAFGQTIEVEIFPKPVQSELPVWITTSGSLDTFIYAGKMGVHLLTHLIGQDIPSLAQKILAYRQARKVNNYNPSDGIVSLMLHTYLGSSVESAMSEVAGPFREYLRSSIALERKTSESPPRDSGGRRFPDEDISGDDMDDLLDVAFERYSKTAALFGTEKSTAGFIDNLAKIGVDEIACLVDFGLTTDQILTSMNYLDLLRAMYESKPNIL